MIIRTPNNTTDYANLLNPGAQLCYLWLKRRESREVETVTATSPFICMHSTSRERWRQFDLSLKNTILKLISKSTSVELAISPTIVTKYIYPNILSVCRFNQVRDYHFRPPSSLLSRKALHQYAWIWLRGRWNRYRCDHSLTQRFSWWLEQLESLCSPFTETCDVAFLSSSLDIHPESGLATTEARHCWRFVKLQRAWAVLWAPDLSCFNRSPISEHDCKMSLKSQVTVEWFSIICTYCFVFVLRMYCGEIRGEIS